ncbi:MAG TPA: PocR ligand-binding domain-containing protein [Methanosarcina sp.]|nr:PocR ligand-binding domain-containing protein [Methanosarcina sp.]
MTAKMEQFSAINSNPVLSVAKDGVILYSNKAGEPLLHDWGVRTGEKLPLNLEIFVQRAISRKSIEKIEVTMGKKVYFIVFHSLPEQECVNIYGFDISGRKKLEGKRLESETQENENLELARIIDTKAIQSLMSDFYTLAHIPMALLDLKGDILVSVGWQEICVKFHRFNHEACEHCVESDINLTAGVTPGGYKLYKCKNNMWDVVTPIMVEGQHVGNIFSGQFFFDDEPLNYELFRSQARQYGFNEKEYIAALEKVPRLSRKAVDTSMAFFMTFANMISKLSYSNIKLSQSLAERDAVVDALLESEKREHARSDELAAVLDAVPVSVYIAHDSQALQITGNRLSCEWLRVPVGTNFSKSAPEGERPEMFKLFKDGVEIPPSKMPSQLSAAGIEINDCELDIVSADGEIRHVLGNARPLLDEQGNLRGSISAFIDITERKKAEQALKKAHETLEEKVKERTAELQEAYNSLKESEERLADSQKTAHIGNWDWNIATNDEYWSDELYHIFGLDPQLELNHNTFLSRIHPDDFNYVNNSINEALNGKSYYINYRIILPDGEERIIYSEGEVLFDEKHKPVRMRGIVQDITERKKAEEALANIEIARKKEIHHRIKNNLQVISSLLDLQAEQFRNRNDIKDSEVLEAFRESQDRVISMALIHEELYKGEEFETLNFSPYIEELANTLFQTYSLGDTEIRLNMDLEENFFFDMDIAVPLGMIINELVSNSLKHAFPDREKGEIRIKLSRDENEECAKSITEACKRTNFILTVSDDGVGIPENLKIEDLDSLGFQLVTSLVDQLDGEFELKRNNGTEFTTRFTVIEKR